MFKIVYLMVFNSLPNDKILVWSKLKVLVNDIINVIEKLKFVLGRVENIVGKGENAGNGERRKCWLLAFSPFPTMFLRGFFHRVVKSRDCVV